MQNSTARPRFSSINCICEFISMHANKVENKSSIAVATSDACRKSIYSNIWGCCSLCLTFCRRTVPSSSGFLSSIIFDGASDYTNFRDIGNINGCRLFWTWADYDNCRKHEVTTDINKPIYITARWSFTHFCDKMMLII